MRREEAIAERERILVVEDDPALAELLRAHLAAAGDAARVVTDGLATLRAFEQERPAQVTLDLTVPTISGFRLVRLIRWQRSGDPKRRWDQPSA